MGSLGARWSLIPSLCRTWVHRRLCWRKCDGHAKQIQMCFCEDKTPPSPKSAVWSLGQSLLASWAHEIKNLGIRAFQSFFQLVIALGRNRPPHSPWILRLFVLFSDDGSPWPSVWNPSSLVWLFLFGAPPTSPASHLTHPFLQHLSPSQTKLLAVLNAFVSNPHPKPLCLPSRSASPAFALALVRQTHPFTCPLPWPFKTFLSCCLSPGEMDP